MDILVVSVRVLANPVNYSIDMGLQRGKDFLIIIFTTYIPASIHNEAMLSGAWTSIAQ